MLHSRHIQGIRGGLALVFRRNGLFNVLEFFERSILDRGRVWISINDHFASFERGGRGGYIVDIVRCCIAVIKLISSGLIARMINRRRRSGWIGVKIVRVLFFTVKIKDEGRRKREECGRWEILVLNFLFVWWDLDSYENGRKKRRKFRKFTVLLRDVSSLLCLSFVKIVIKVYEYIQNFVYHYLH